MSFRRLLLAAWMPALWVTGSVLTFSAATSAQAATFDSSSQERQLFRQTRDQLQRVQLTKAQAGVTALKHYPLAPYLELPLLLSRLNELPYADVDAFFKRYPDSVSSDSLRGAWLSALAQNQRWPDFLTYYDGATAGKAQQCWRLEALHRTGAGQQALAETENLWLSPIDLPTPCDDALNRWLAAAPDKLNDRIWQRLLLALNQNEEGLARHLVDRLDSADKSTAELALLAYRSPQTIGSLQTQLGNQPRASSILSLGLQKLAKTDLDTSLQLWKDWNTKGLLNAGDSFAARNEIGRRLIGGRGDAALPWLLENDPRGTDSYLLEWRVRLSLRSGDWVKIASWIELMPADMAQTPRWRYWHARALATSDDPVNTAHASALYKSLADDRSYYGFLAADHSAQPYSLNHQPVKPAVSVEQVAKRADMRRAREFFVLDERGGARREWARAFRTMTMDEKKASAVLAKSWGWYDQALRLAQMSDSMDDLDLRFPVAYRGLMETAARSRGLPTEWLFAVARQESAFMADARSPVGASGLLQLMPATAQLVGKSLGMRVSPSQLIEPETNIPLGSKYLSDLSARYAGNRVLATAAYNAGPGRVSRLLAQQTKPVSMDVWVETFPIRETREYIQSVLAFAVIYSERLGMPKSALVASNERVIGRTVQVSQAEDVGGSTQQ